MPTYAYKCPKCGHQYDAFQKMNDKNRAKCPKCGTRGDRLISGGAGLLFKGSGFYITDYKKSGDRKSDGESTSSKPEKSEKPAEKSSDKPKKTSGVAS